MKSISEEMKRLLAEAESSEEADMRAVMAYEIERQARAYGRDKAIEAIDALQSKRKDIWKMMDPKNARLKEFVKMFMEKDGKVAESVVREALKDAAESFESYDIKPPGGYPSNSVSDRIGHILNK